MIGQVLDDGEIEVEVRGWNTTPTMRNGFAGRRFDIMAEYADMTRWTA
jgi:hypothetical protein